MDPRVKATPAELALQHELAMRLVRALERSPPEPPSPGERPARSRRRQLTQLLEMIDAVDAAPRESAQRVKP